MENKYLIRRAHNNTDIQNIRTLLNSVFYPEKVGDLARVFSNSLPGVSYENWYVAEDKETSEIVASFVLIPWVWEMQAVKLKVAEMGMVGTNEKHRGKGIMKLLNKEFNKTLLTEKFDLAVIQGIPGFYHKFGYHYTIPMENHLNIDLRMILDSYNTHEFHFREATRSDIPFLIKEDEDYKNLNFLSVYRSAEHWEYILNQGKETEYGSDILIIESLNERKYCRILYNGFGNGLIVSEISSCISEIAFKNLLHFLKDKALAKGKPYIRFNLANESNAGSYLISYGVEASKSYAWQIKVPDKKCLLNSLKPILELKLTRSDFNNFDGVIRLDFYNEAIDLYIKNGKVITVEYANGAEIEHVFCIPDDLFAALALAYRDWGQLQYNRPDIAAMDIYINPKLKPLNCETLKLINVLFPKEDSWVYLQY